MATETGWELSKLEKQLLVASAIILLAVYVYRTFNPVQTCG